MKRLDVPTRGLIAGAALATALAFAGPPPAAAQDATTTTTTSESTTTLTLRKRKPRTTATRAMIAEAIDRSKARTRRFLSEGVPEQFGSEGGAYTFSFSNLEVE